MIFTVLLVSLGRAQEPNEAPPNLEGWRSELAKAESALAKGGARRAERALEIGRQILQEQLEWLGRGELAQQLLGETLLVLAVAEARVGWVDQARWRWAEALNLVPALGPDRLPTYPDVAPLFEKVTLSGDFPEAGANQVAPKPVWRAPVNYPALLREQAVGGTSEVLVAVDTRGLPEKPLLRSSCGVPGFDVAVMEAARQWTFSPATQGGSPVPGSYLLRVGFRIGG